MAPSYRRVPPAIRPDPGEQEEREIGRLRFRIVSFFDVSQTDAIGETQLSPSRVHLSGDPGLAPEEAAKIYYDVALHLAAHVECRMERETIAESVVCVVLGRYGIQTPDYDFSYLASWSDLATIAGPDAGYSGDRHSADRIQRRRKRLAALSAGSLGRSPD